MNGESGVLYQEYAATKLYDRFHIHDEIQITYIKEGEGELLVGNELTAYQAGDLIAIGSQLPHAFRSDESFTTQSTVSLYFKSNAFGVNFFNTPEMQMVAPFFKNIQRGILLRGACKDTKTILDSLTNLDHFDRLLALLRIIKCLTENNFIYLSSKGVKKQSSEIKGLRMKAIIDYTMSNYAEEIYLEEVSSIANLNPNSFCRYFKQHTNKTYLTFLTEVRLNAAIRLLGKRIDLSVEEIAELSGFRNMSNFYRQFRSLKGTTPLQYRKRLLSLVSEN